MPALMILKSALTLLLLMASRQAEITWFLGLPTEEKDEQRQIGEYKHYNQHSGALSETAVPQPHQ